MNRLEQLQKQFAKLESEVNALRRLDHERKFAKAFRKRVVHTGFD